MGYRKLTMGDVSELLRRWHTRQGVRQIARETGLDRKTVRRYIAAANSYELRRERDLTEEDVARVAERVQARPPAARSDAWKQLAKHEELIAASLYGQKRRQLRKVHTRLAGEGVNVTYWTLRRFVIRSRLVQASAPRIAPLPLDGPGGAGPVAGAMAEPIGGE